MRRPRSMIERMHDSHGAYHNPAALEIWATFATAVAEAVALAGERLFNPTLLHQYSAKRGWWRSRRRTNLGGVQLRIPSEDSVTDALVEQLERLRSEAGPGNPLLDLNIAFAGQQPRRLQTAIGPSGRTTDIRAWVPDRTNLDMRIEAKILFEHGDLTSEYLGQRGLLRFADPQNPYSDTPVGAMLGFLVAPAAEPWNQLVDEGIRTVAEATAVDQVMVAGYPEPLNVCDMRYGEGRKLVTVLHLSIRQHTMPSGWPVGGQDAWDKPPLPDLA